MGETKFFEVESFESEGRIGLKLRSLYPFRFKNDIFDFPMQRIPLFAVGGL
jgi:hypothetical protein